MTYAYTGNRWANGAAHRAIAARVHSHHWLCINEYDRARYRRKMARVGYVRGPYKVR